VNASIGTVTLVPYTSNVGYDYTSLRAVAQVTDIPLALTVRADSPLKNVKEFVEYAKANPGKIRYGSPGAGNIQHVNAEGWAKKIGIKLTHMPFEGANPAIAALLGGHVEATVTGVTEAAPHHKSGALRILGVTSANRIKMVDAPTFKEQGYDLEAGVWYGVLVPKATPDDIVKILADALKKAYDSPKVQDAWNKLFLIPAYLGPAELDARIKKEAELNQQILKDIGLHKK
jgi:tripartite-type tricarboxylate transporter receptor subunit TctC